MSIETVIDGLEARIRERENDIARQRFNEIAQMCIDMVTAIRDDLGSRFGIFEAYPIGITDYCDYESNWWGNSDDQAVYQWLGYGNPTALWFDVFFDGNRTPITYIIAPKDPENQPFITADDWEIEGCPRYNAFDGVCDDEALLKALRAEKEK